MGMGTGMGTEGWGQGQGTGQGQGESGAKDRDGNGDRDRDRDRDRDGMGTATRTRARTGDRDQDHSRAQGKDRAQAFLRAAQAARHWSSAVPWQIASYLSFFSPSPGCLWSQVAAGSSLSPGPRGERAELSFSAMWEPRGAPEAPAEGWSCGGLQEPGCCSAVTSSMFLFQSSSKGGEQDGKNSRKKGFCLNNMPPELLHGYKGTSYVATYLIWILMMLVLSV